MRKSKGERFYIRLHPEGSRGYPSTENDIATKCCTRKYFEGTITCTTTERHPTTVLENQLLWTSTTGDHSGSVGWIGTGVRRQKQPACKNGGPEQTSKTTDSSVQVRVVPRERWMTRQSATRITGSHLTMSDSRDREPQALGNIDCAAYEDEGRNSKLHTEIPPSTKP